MHIARQKDNVAVVGLDGALSSGDRESLDSLEQLCMNLINGGARCILLSMKGLRTAPSVFLATLASLQSRVRALGGEIAVVHPSNHVRKLFRVTAMDKVVALFSDEQSAGDVVKRRLEEMERTLQDDLASPRRLTRIEAASKLARIGDERGFSLLSELLSDDDAVMRLQTTLSLAGIGGPRVVEPLIRALSDGDYRVRMYAAEALGKSADPRAVEPLKAAVRFECNRNVIFKANQALEKLLVEAQPFATA